MALLPDNSVRRTLSLDAGWLHHAGEVDAPLPNTHIAAYMVTKAGYARGAARPGFDDSLWRTVDLPHDASIEQPFDPAHHISNGYLPRGVHWYRRHFALEKSMRMGSVALRFDGVAGHCTVYVNGHLVHRHCTAYTPFEIDITPIANVGPDSHNTIAIRVDSSPVEGWWYEGAGIDRHVWLIATGLVRVMPDSHVVRPERVSRSAWNVAVGAELENQQDVVSDAVVRSELFDAAGRWITQAETSIALDARSRDVPVDLSMKVDLPALWSLESPALYTLRTTVFERGRAKDRVSARIGFRTIRFDAERGFFLNELPVKLLGTCNHQDHGGLGVALPDSIHRFRIRRLKSMGSNAYRCAHHPPAPELLDACDELGMLVMDENRFFGTSPEHMTQLGAMVRRDRNHPSVILWSICNEEAIQGTTAAGAIARVMVAQVKRLDPTRPVTGAVSGGILNDGAIGDALDVMCINYQLPLHDTYHAKHPHRPLIAGETHCVYATRDQRTTDAERHRFEDADREVAKWGASAESTWAFVKERPFIAGLFVWTGFDYRGEPTPHTWPSVQTHWGLLDLCGFPKRAFAIHQAWWGGRGDPLAGVPVLGASAAATTLGIAIDPDSQADAILADGRHAIAVTLFATDASGRRADVDLCLNLRVRGGKVLGVANGNPTNHDPPAASSVRLFHGLAQAIIQIDQGVHELAVEVSSESLAPTSRIIPTTPAEPMPSTAPAPQRFVAGGWRVSSWLDRPDDAAGTLSSQDMNTWQAWDPVSAQPIGEAGKWLVFPANARPPAIVQQRGGKLRLGIISGAGHVEIAGRQRATWDAGEHRLEIDLEPGLHDATLRISLRSEGQPVGLLGRVEWIV